MLLWQHRQATLNRCTESLNSCKLLVAENEKITEYVDLDE